MERSNNTIFATALLFSLTSAGFAASQDVRVLSSDAGGIVVEYRPQFERTTVTSGSAVFDRWVFDQAQPDERQAAGFPARRLRSFVVGLPGSEGHTTEILAVEYETISNVMLEPVPEPGEEDGMLVSIYGIDPAAYAVNEFLPSTLAELSQIRIVRGLVVGDLRLFPLQYNASARTLRKYSRIVARVNFGPATYKAVRRSEDRLLKGFLLNEEVAAGWSAEPHLRQRYRSSVFTEGEWFRFTISEAGMYKLTGTQLLGAGVPTSIDPRTIKVYSNGGTEPPVDPAAPYPDDVLEVAVYVNDGGTPNQLDASDYVIFYGEAPRGWQYNPTTKTFSHTINLYSEVSYYWVTYGGSTSKRMTEEVSLVGPSSLTFSTVTGKVFREDERVNVQLSGKRWLGQSFNNGDAVTYLFSLPGFEPSQPLRYRFNVGARNTGGASQFEIREHDNLLTNVSMERTDGGYFAPYVVMKNVLVAPVSNPFTESSSRLRFAFTSGSSGIGYIDWIEVFYQRRFVAENNVFQFHSHDTTGNVRYAVGGFSSTPVWVFDVSRHDSVIRIVNPIVAGDSCVFGAAFVQGKLHEFYVVGESAFKAPSGLQSFQRQNLAGDSANVDVIIITSTDLLPAAQRLKSHRERSGPDRLSVRIVETSAIYNEFSGGQPGPVGIRNYLRYVFRNWINPPPYVVLLGNGHFDYKGISTSIPNRVPAWQTYESFADVPLRSYGTDDSLAIFAGSSKVQFAVGRLPARSLDEANNMVDKIVEYETTHSGDPWKLRVTLVADDGREEGTAYARDSEGIAGLIPPLFEVQKIYSAEYPLVVTSVGARRPSVNQAITSSINQGTLILSFIGHGNPRLWAHEHIFVRETDFPNLTNASKYFILVAATCNYSQYDNPFDQSGGEQLVAKKRSGAISSISASRAVFAGDNYFLSRTLFSQLLSDTLGRIRRPRLGDTFFKTKQQHSGGTYENDKKFLLIGDPALRVAIPELHATIDTINAAPTTSSVRVRSLDVAQSTARMRDSSFSQLDVNGQALVTVYDADRRVTVNKPNEGFSNFTYTAPGGVVFRGTSRVDAGRIQSAFVVPKDISHDTTRPGRISLYMWNDAVDGAGVTRNIVFGGTNPNAAVDTSGPKIELYLDGRNFRPGDVVSDNPVLIADLFDENGINLSDIGIGHRLEAWIDDASESTDLTPYYKSLIDSYQQGTIEYVISGLNPGTHRLKLRAWDTYNNAQTAQTVFDVGSSQGLQITRLFNYPNPFSRTTTFTFQHTQLVPVDVEVKIYTVAGRLIESLKQTGISDQFVRVPWNGRDRDGDELGNGVYLYKVIVRTQDGRFTSEVLGKLSKVR
jgi:hypothetical protein